LHWISYEQESVRAELIKNSNVCGFIFLSSLFISFYVFMYTSDYLTRDNLSNGLMGKKSKREIPFYVEIFHFYSELFSFLSYSKLLFMIFFSFLFKAIQNRNGGVKDFLSYFKSTHST
jgi:hypothetical protein